jgi:hypothetical protein
LRIVGIITVSISLCLEAWLVWLLVRQRVHERFQLFVSYIAVAGLASLLRLVVLHFVLVHFFVYWASELLLMLLSIAALNQVFWHTYSGFDFIWWFRPLYYGAILLALGLTIRAAIVSPPVVSHPLISFIVDAELAANMVRAGIVAVFAAMVRPMVVRFQRYAFGIILGFGFSSFPPCVAYISISAFGTRVKAFADIMASLSYIVALIVWLRVFSLPDTKLTKWEPPIPPEEMAGTVESYLKAFGITRKRKRTK